jgi:hypothetical protein
MTPHGCLLEYGYKKKRGQGLTFVSEIFVLKRPADEGEGLKAEVAAKRDKSARARSLIFSKL